MDTPASPPSTFQRLRRAWNHPYVNVAFLAWGILLAVALATARDDVYTIAKAGEVVVLALRRLLIKREIRLFFRCLFAAALAVPVALYTTSPIFWGHFVSPASAEFPQLVLLGGLCAAPLFLFALWGLRWERRRGEPERPDPGWFRFLDQGFKWTLAAMVLSFRLANPAIVVGGMLVIVFGMTALAAARLRLTRVHVGNFLLIVGAGTAGVTLLLIPLGIAHVDGEEAALAVVPGMVVATFGLWIRASTPKDAPSLLGRTDERDGGPGSAAD